jgi:N-methylhydantoinase A
MALLAFGGAGPMLGGFLGRELEMAEILVPPTPGVLSALGGLIADLKSDFLRTLYVPLDADATPEICAGFAALRTQALRWLREEQGHAGPVTLRYSADLRYRGQSYELEAEIPEAAAEAGDVAALAAAFRAEHERVYGHADAAAPIQLIALRLVGAGPTRKPALPKLPRGTTPPEPVAVREVWLDGGWRPVDFYARHDLLAGQRFAGPAVVTQDDCTTCIPPGFSVLVDDYGSLRIRPEAAA